MERQQMYDFVTGLVDIVTNSTGLWGIAGPFVLMGAIVGFVRWAFNRARGSQDYEALQADMEMAKEGLQNRISYGRGYAGQRREGFSDRELSRARQERAGRRIR